jgi:hypothetical protein
MKKSKYTVCFPVFAAVSDHIMFFFRVLHDVVINVLEEHSASIFTVTELVTIDAEMIWSKKCQLCRPV